jgi:16S rRNA (guanine966-N2)-methyltransferase
MSLRLIAGTLGGRYIAVPPGRITRPTGARVREAWFNLLGDRLEGAAVLDLFAGSGALGIEALSRGAAVVHFVERDRRVFEVLRRNIESLGVTEQAVLHRRDVFRFLASREAAGVFDIALADPPYDHGLAVRLVEEFRSRPFAELFCLEHGATESIGGSADRQRRYGDTVLSFFTAPKGGRTGAS